MEVELPMFYPQTACDDVVDQLQTLNLRGFVMSTERGLQLGTIEYLDAGEGVSLGDALQPDFPRGAFALAAWNDIQPALARRDVELRVQNDGRTVRVVAPPVVIQHLVGGFVRYRCPGPAPHRLFASQAPQGRCRQHPGQILTIE